jgi:hypothetical protein
VIDPSKLARVAKVCAGEENAAENMKTTKAAIDRRRLVTFVAFRPRVWTAGKEPKVRGYVIEILRGKTRDQVEKLTRDRKTSVVIARRGNGQ